MDSSNAEKAWDEYRETYPGPVSGYDVAIAFNEAFASGRASRDAEVAELTAENERLAARVDTPEEIAASDAALTGPILRALAESRARFGDSEARRAELEAVRDRVLKMAAEDDAGAWDAHQELIRQVLVAAPSVVLEDRDREIAARTLEDAARVVRAYPSSHSEHVASILDERAAAIRKGDTNA